jgi:aspartate aminotransferase
VSLGVGAYRDDDGKPYVFQSVRKAEEHIISSKLDKEYAPIDGTPGFTQSAQKLLFSGEDVL